MALSKAQTSLYWRTWAAIAAAIKEDLPEADRKFIDSRRRPHHAQAGCPASSKDWTNQHLSRWLLHACRITDPLNITRHLELEEQCHPQATKIFRIRQLLTQLGKPIAYAAACAKDPLLSPNLCNWPADALQRAVQALSHTARHQKPGATPQETGF